MGGLGGLSGLNGLSGVVGAAVASGDPDALAYIAAVEAADGQILEPVVRAAIESFVVGCKADTSPNAGVSNFEAIKASCLIIGARTLAGALVPLKGVAPTNFGFSNIDYSRTLGLRGNGINDFGSVTHPGYLAVNRTDAQDPQNNQHLSVFRTAPPTGGDSLALLNSDDLGGAGASFMYTSSGSTVWSRLSTTAAVSHTIPSPSNPVFIGISRHAASQYLVKCGISNFVVGSPSAPRSGRPLFCFRAGSYRNTHRMAFYSVGESIDLAALDARVTTLRNAIVAALA